jgi:hypothetical protein
VATNRRLKTTAAPSRWSELGRRLRHRREMELDYPDRPEFEEVTGLNYRMISDIENMPPGRANTVLDSTLKYKVAPAYQVTFESIVAFLKQETDDLVPAPPAPAAAPPAVPSFLGPSPIADEARSAAARPHVQAICEALVRAGYLREVVPGWYERTGAPEPSGAELFGEGAPDARTWDDPNLRRTLSVAQMVWLLADIRRSDEAREGNSSGVAGALRSGAVC